MTAPGRIRVLIVENNRSDAELNLRHFERGGLAVEHRIVYSEREFERELEEFKPDVIVSDFTVPRFDGMAALALAHRQTPDTPFIFVSDTIGEEHAIRALKDGAIDYVLKGDLLRLPAAVERALRVAKGRTARQKAVLKPARARDQLQGSYESSPDALSINERVAEQVDLENRLRRAVDRRELFFHFQPKVDMETKRIVGLEALMRWRGPDQQLVSPLRFVPVLEETGLILDAGRQAIEVAAALHRQWGKLGLTAPRIAVNVSALQLRQRSFVEDVVEAFGGPDSGVDLEITEGLLMEDIEESIRKLRALREVGACVALDDFGTGHSSLAYLSRLPIDTVKIDRSFIHSMTENADATSIVSTIISLAKALRYKVVAEGVETEEQAQLLRLLRCDQMQGYLFSPPVDKEKVESLLRAS